MSEWVESRCIACGALLDEEDLFCGNCGRSVETQTGSGSARSEVASTRDRPLRSMVVHHFECQSCGASMTYDAHAQTLRCPFCGSTRVDEKPARRVLCPDWFVPFEVDRPQAERRLRQTLKRGFFRPGDLAATAEIETISSVFVPYWIFTASTHSYWTADSSDTPMHARADWVPVFGQINSQYYGVLVGASNTLSQVETMQLEPFQLDERRPYDDSLAERFTIEQFAVPRKYARPLARQGLEERERHAVASRFLPRGHRNLKVNMRVRGLASEPVLLPIWIMAYRYQDRLYRFLINGQTGKVTGQVPLSRLRVLVAVIGIVLLLLLLVALAAIATGR